VWWLSAWKALGAKWGCHELAEAGGENKANAWSLKMSGRRLFYFFLLVAGDFHLRYRS